MHCLFRSAAMRQPPKKNVKRLRGRPTCKDLWRWCGARLAGLVPASGTVFGIDPDVQRSLQERYFSCLNYGRVRGFSTIAAAFT